MTAAEFSFYKGMAEQAVSRFPKFRSIVIDNRDGLNDGFNDPAPATPEGGNAGTTLGQQRLNLFTHAAAIWGAFPIAPCPSRQRQI